MKSTPPHIVCLFALVFLTALAAVPACATGTAEDRTAWPRRVLITNDNGIDDIPLIELARALAEVAEVHVVASTTDRSGTSNLLSAVRTGEFRVERRQLGDNIEAYALDGYPADCVMFALVGPMRERVPDLVISGINGGPNLGDAWFGSGTIGAARTAAYFGLPAVAISGVEDDDPAAVQAAVQWVVELVRSDVVRSLRPPQYLTVSLPQTVTGGVEVVTRARGVISAVATPLDAASTGVVQTWRLDLQDHPEAAPDGSDVAAYGRGAIAVVPMRVDESDPELLGRLQAEPGLFPAWVPPARPSEGARACPSGFGAVIDDAEDEDGREWGVLIEEILAGGRAEEIGLRAGDVIVSLNGVSLETPRRSREDPDDRFVALLEELGCGDTVTLDYSRDGDLGRATFRMPETPEP